MSTTLKWKYCDLRFYKLEDAEVHECDCPRSGEWEARNNMERLASAIIKGLAEGNASSQSCAATAAAVLRVTRAAADASVINQHDQVLAIAEQLLSPWVSVSYAASFASTSTTNCRKPSLLVTATVRKWLTQLMTSLTDLGQH